MEPTQRPFSLKRPSKDHQAWPPSLVGSVSRLPWRQRHPCWPSAFPMADQQLSWGGGRSTSPECRPFCLVWGSLGGSTRQQRPQSPPAPGTFGCPAPQGCGTSARFPLRASFWGAIEHLGGGPCGGITEAFILSSGCPSGCPSHAEGGWGSSLFPQSAPAQSGSTARECNWQMGSALISAAAALGSFMASVCVHILVLCKHSLFGPWGFRVLCSAC